MEEIANKYKDMTIGDQEEELVFEEETLEEEGGSAEREVVPRIRPPPEPPPWVVRDARVRESFPISFHSFVFWFLVIVYVVRFVILFGILALFYVIEYVWIYENMDGCVKPVTWLVIRVALSGVIVSKAHHRVYSRCCWSLAGVNFVFFVNNV
ncbi:unnamed protein product, partial [Cuscuta epithymum]